MERTNSKNVYSGPDSMRNYFNPDFQPLLPLVELPGKLNPYRRDNVRIYAKMMTALPAQNVKALPALNMLMNAGPSARKAIVEPSSGSTVTSLAMVSRVLHQNDDVCALVSNKTEASRLRTLQFFGLKVLLYGGPSQPEISDPRGAIAKAHQMAESNSNIWNPGQYENENNPAAHMRWTGPQLLEQLPQINIFCMGMGSAGCITGTGRYLKSHKPATRVVGVCNKTGDSIPGPRPFSLMPSSQFPWRQVVDDVKEVSSVEAYRLSMSLSREGLICGPSSGMALKGLLEFLQEAKDERRLDQYAEAATGEISCVFTCCDLPYQYLDGYFKRLGEDSFCPIINRSLLSVDTGNYDPEWEIDNHKAVSMLFVEGVTTLLDLRSSQDFELAHLGVAVSVPLSGLNATTKSPFDDNELLERQWRDLQEMVSREGYFCNIGPLAGPAIMLCYNGEAARLACSVMRERGIEAYSIKGGTSRMGSIQAYTT